MTGGRLQGLGIVITRPRAAAEALATSLAREGARPFVFPALEIEPLPDSPGLSAALSCLVGARLAIFVSANAVQAGWAAARRHGPWPRGVRVAGVGEATAQALGNAGFGEVITPRERQDSDGLLALPELSETSVRGTSVVIFRGVGGRERLKEALEARGARVAYAECYRRVRPQADAGPLLAAWSRGEIHAVSALSGETVENFVEMLGPEGREHLAATTLAVPHEAIAAHPAARHFARVLVCGPGANALADSLSQLRVSP